MTGLADYVAGVPCVYPPIVSEWASITPQQIATFTDPDFCRGDCFAGLGALDLSQISLTAPGGFFSTGDVTQWGAGEWLAVGAGVYFLVSLTQDVRRLGKRVGGRVGKIRRGFTK